MGSGCANEETAPQPGAWPPGSQCSLHSNTCLREVGGLGNPPRAEMLQAVGRGRSAALAMAPAPPGTQPQCSQQGKPSLWGLTTRGTKLGANMWVMDWQGRSQVTLISTAAPGRCRLPSAVWVHRSPREVLPLWAVQEPLPHLALLSHGST